MNEIGKLCIKTDNLLDLMIRDMGHQITDGHFFFHIVEKDGHREKHVSNHRDLDVDGEVITRIKMIVNPDEELLAAAFVAGIFKDRAETLEEVKELDINWVPMAEIDDGEFIEETESVDMTRDASTDSDILNQATESADEIL